MDINIYDHYMISFHGYFSSVLESLESMSFVLCVKPFFPVIRLSTFFPPVGLIHWNLLYQIRCVSFCFFLVVFLVRVLGAVGNILLLIYEVP